MENLNLEDHSPEWLKPLYQIGDRLKLRLLSASASDQHISRKIVFAKIDHIYEDNTAAVFRVELEGDLPVHFGQAEGKFVILKLYDRRHALRKWGFPDLVSRDSDPFGKNYDLGLCQDTLDCHDDPGYDMYAGYYGESMQYIKDLGAAHEVLGLTRPKLRFTGPGAKELQGDPNYAELLSGAEIVDRRNEDILVTRGSEESVAAIELSKEERERESTQREFVEKLRHIQRACLEQAYHEEQVYERLKPLQKEGKLPIYLSSVELVVEREAALPVPHLDLPPGDRGARPEQSGATRVRQYLKIPGALLTFVEGTPLSRLEKIAPRADHKRIISAAVALVNSTHKYDVLNKDLRPEKVLVKMHNTEGGKTSYKPVLIDFGEARTRRIEEYIDGDTGGLRHWRHQKWIYNEEGAIGGRMYSQLKRGKFPLTYDGTLQFAHAAEAPDGGNEEWTTSSLLHYRDPFDTESRVKIDYNELCEWSAFDEEKAELPLKATGPFPPLKSGLVTTGNAGMARATFHLD